MREATYSSDRVSTTTDSTPSAASRWDSSMPAGPAPMIATWVRTSSMGPVKAHARAPATAALPLAGSVERAADAACGDLQCARRAAAGRA